MRQLVFLEVGVNPQEAVRGNQRQQLRAAADERTGPRAAVANHAIERRANFGIAEIQRGHLEVLWAWVRGGQGLLLAGIQHRQLAFGGGFIRFAYPARRAPGGNRRRRYRGFVRKSRSTRPERYSAGCR